MRRALCLLTLACAAAATGCGGDDGGGDEDEVRRVMRDYVTALAAGNGQRACEQLTSAAQKEVVDTVTASYPSAGGVSCEDAVGDLSADIEPDRKRAMLNPEVNNVEIVGDSAEVTLKGVTGKTTLSRVEGNWQVAGTEIAG